MSDVVKTAAKYRARLHAELVKVDEFIQFAERMAKMAEGQPRIEPITAPVASTEEPKPAASVLSMEDTAKSQPAATSVANGRPALFRGAFQAIEPKEKAAVG